MSSLCCCPDSAILARRFAKNYCYENWNLATEIGLNTDHLDLAILGGKHSRAFTQDLQEAQDLGLRGVPYFIFDRKVAIHGAREVEVFEKALGA